MKTLFKIGVFVVGMFFAVSAQASALYWQVTQGTTDQAFQYAQLKVTGGDLASPTVVDMAEAEGTAPNNYVSITSSELGQYGADGYSFFVEMVNYSNDEFQTVATGATYSYNELVSSGYVATGAISTAAAQAAASQANMGSPIPEPSSGLLLLMGGAMLALRRRRQK